MLLMRYLIINNYRGDFHYYTMNLFGKVIKKTLTVILIASILYML